MHINFKLVSASTNPPTAIHFLVDHDNNRIKYKCSDQSIYVNKCYPLQGQCLSYNIPYIRRIRRSLYSGEQPKSIKLHCN